MTGRIATRIAAVLAPSARRRSVFSPWALPAGATHRDGGKVRDVDAGQGDALLNEKPTRNLDANLHPVTLYRRALCQECP